MLKEIAEQPRGGRRHAARPASTPTAGWRSTRCGCPTSELRDIDKIVIIACGTAYHAGLIAKYAIEHWTRIPCEVELASEFRYRDPILTRTTLVIAISQSGETMDTLMALRHAREQRAQVLAICNVNGSTHPARVRRGPLHARRARGRRRVDEGVPHPDRRRAPRRALPRPGARHQVGRRDRAHVRELAAMPGEGRPGARHHRAGARAGPRARRREGGAVPRPARGLSRSRWRARSSSRSSRTCTPRASRPASSSTARSR